MLSRAVREPPIQLRQRLGLRGMMPRRWARVPPSENNPTSSLEELPASREAAASASALAARTLLREIMDGEGSARSSIANSGPRPKVLPDYTANSAAQWHARAGVLPRLSGWRVGFLCRETRLGSGSKQAFDIPRRVCHTAGAGEIPPPLAILRKEEVMPTMSTSFSPSAAASLLPTPA